MNEHRKGPNVPNTDQTTRVREDSLNVYDDGRFTIPAAIRNAYGLVPHQLVHVVVILGDGEEEHFNRAMDEDGQVTIPAQIRNEHGIEDGGQVDIALVVDDG